MADSYIPFWNVGNTVAGSPDLKFDAETLTVGANTVLRERVEVTGSGATEIARVQATDPAGSEMALVTRNIPSGTQPVSAASLPLPAGAATLAEQQTQTADLATLAGAVAAGRMATTARVQDGAGNALTSLAAGAQRPLSVAILDGAGAQITSFGGGTQYTEGDVDASITGTAILWEDTGDTLRSVSAAKPLPVAIISGAGSGGTAMADDAAFTPATTSVTPVAGIYRSSRDAVDDGDAGALAMTPTRALLTSLESTSGQKVAVATSPNPDWTQGGLQVAVHGVIAGDTAFGGTEYGLPLFGKRHDANTALATVDGRFAPVQMSALGALKVAITEGGGSGGTAMADDAAFTVATTNVTPVAGVYKSTLDAVDDGDAGALAMTQKRALYVSHLTPAGDSMVDDTASVDALQVTLMTMAQVIGSCNNDDADTQGPVKIGGRASSDMRNAVSATNDRVDALFDVDGALIHRPAATALFVDGNASNTDGTSTQVIAAGAAGVRTYLCDVAITNTHVSQFAYVEIKDGATARYTLPVPPSGGVVKSFNPPLRGSAATAWNFDPSAATTTLICSMSGYQAKV